MKLHLLEKIIDQFLSATAREEEIDWYYPHSIVNEFHTHWSSPSSQGLKSMYDHCLQSDYSHRWWNREKYNPKEVMFQLMDADPELATIAWKDLFNDSASLEGRLRRFDYYCNELLQIHRQKNPMSVESYHQQDACMMSLYLSGMFPDKYALYPGLSIFKDFCISVGSPDIPVIDDLVRYMKVASIVFTYLKKNQRFDDFMQQRQSSSHKVKAIPFQVAYEVIVFAGDRNKIPGP